MRILLIDDEVHIGNLVVDELRERFHDATFMVNPASVEAFLEILETRLPEALVVDYNMPIKGTVFYQSARSWCRATKRRLAVVLYTKYGPGSHEYGEMLRSGLHATQIVRKVNGAEDVERILGEIELQRAGFAA
jgi:CheY-like chemotaxis protein